jgi:hypothetical protein
MYFLIKVVVQSKYYGKYSADFSGLSRHLLITCLDYFVFPYLKNNVLKNRPGTIPELMQVITDTLQFN